MRRLEAQQRVAPLHGRGKRFACVLGEFRWQRKGETMAGNVANSEPDKVGDVAAANRAETMIDRFAGELSRQAVDSRRRLRVLHPQQRKVARDTLVILDGKYLITTPSAAKLAALCDLRVDYTVDRYLRSLPCSDVEELIGRTVAAHNRMLRSSEEIRQLSQLCTKQIKELEQIRATWGMAPTRRWSPDSRRPRTSVSVTSATNLPISQLDQDAEQQNE